MLNTYKHHHTKEHLKLNLWKVEQHWGLVEKSVSYKKSVYSIKSHSSAWFSAAFATAIAHRSNFFHLHQQNKSSVFKATFRQAKNCCRRVPEVANLVEANKARGSTTIQRIVLRDFWWIAISVLNKVSLLFVLYWMVLWCFFCIL